MRVHPASQPAKERRQGSAPRVPELPLQDLSHRRIQPISSWVWVSLALLCALAVALPRSLAAQVMARPGWAGSGVSLQVWWRDAVFYRVDPARFQDGAATGKGNLQGLALRMPYLRALGVDGIVLEGSYDDEALSDLLRTAGQNQMRVLMEITPEMQAGDRQQMLAQVHSWLGMGAAGVYVPAPAGSVASQSSQNGTATSGYRVLLLALEGVVRSLPGDRVLLAGAGVADGVSGGDGRGRRGAGLFHAGQDGLLVTRAYLPGEQSRDAAALRSSLSTLAAAGSSESGAEVPVIQFAQSPATGSPNAIALAAALLTSRGDAMFDFGNEIGLDTSSAVSGVAGHAVLPVMQWTPSNVQQAGAPSEVERTPGVTSFGPYRPYVRPPPAALTGAAPGLPGASIDATLPAELPAPDTLPGFTAGPLPSPPVDGARVNVATEERDPQSVLNAYRQLMALHHGNAALQSGAQILLNRDAQGADVWVRRAPAGQKAGDVLVAVNLSDKAVTLALDEDLARLGIRKGSLRPLFTASPTPLTAEQTGALMLPPHAVFVGEIRRRY